MGKHRQHKKGPDQKTQEVAQSQFRVREKLASRQRELEREAEARNRSAEEKHKKQEQRAKKERENVKEDYKRLLTYKLALAAYGTRVAQEALLPYASPEINCSDSGKDSMSFDVELNEREKLEGISYFASNPVEADEVQYCEPFYMEKLVKALAYIDARTNNELLPLDFEPLYYY